VLDEVLKTGVPVDLCGQCLGMWLDQGELEKIRAPAVRPDERQREWGDEWGREEGRRRWRTGAEHSHDPPKQECPTEDRMLEQLYAIHHRRGRRLGRAVLEATRACLFRSWIGHGKDVLDLGCRDGTLTRHLLDGNRVIGVDIDSEALGVAERSYGIRTSRGNLNRSLPFADEQFDVAVLAETLEHLPYPGITLGEVKRILRRGGLFIGNVPLFYHLETRWRVLRGKRIDNDPTHLQYFSYGSLRRLLAEFFAVEELRPIKGRLARYSVRLFAHNVAFRCQKA